MMANAEIPADARKKLDFAYDYRSRRTRKDVSGWNGSIYVADYVLKFVYDGWNLTAEVDETNGILRNYVWGSDLSGSTRGTGGVGGLLMLTALTNGTHFVAFDGNGNVAGFVAGLSGAQTAEYEYGPFGELIRLTGTMAAVNPFRFSTKYVDGEAGLIYYGYRYYHPIRGRWISSDPLGENGGLNLYAGNNNNFVNRHDPLGLRSLDEIEQQYRDMIAASRKRGKNVAADNLEHFLASSGQARTLDWQWLRSFESVRNAEERNREYFVKRLSTEAVALKHGEKRRIYDYFDATETASKFHELYYASGTFTVTSYGVFDLEKCDNTVAITGQVDHFWWDPYDWHAELSAYVPGFGSVSDAEALQLEKAGRAAPFLMQSTWNQKLTATYEQDNFLFFDSSNFKWDAVTGGSSETMSTVIAQMPKGVRPPAQVTPKKGR